jgi:hypothetical protein
VQAAGWGFYTFWVPPREEYLFVMVNYLHTDEDRLFALADQFVAGLGWLS